MLTQDDYRTRRAAELFRQGFAVADVCAILKVSSRWAADIEEVCESVPGVPRESISLHRKPRPVIVSVDGAAALDPPSPED